MDKETMSRILSSRKRGRPKKNEPEKKRVGGTQSRAGSQRTLRSLDSSFVNLDTDDPGELKVFKNEEIKTMLRDIGDSFVRWIIEGKRSVSKETAMKVSCKIQSIKSLLRERKSSIEKSKSKRQRKTADSLEPLLGSAEYLTTVIENYLQDVFQKEQVADGNNSSFADMFQDNIEDNDNYSFNNHNSATKKSILKSRNINKTIKRKSISFAEKATNVYQDNETSQISLQKSSRPGKENKEDNSGIKNQEDNQVKPILVPVVRQSQTTELMESSPCETSFIEESPSIIESSFLNESFPTVLGNYSKNLKKFKSKIRNEKKIESFDGTANYFTKTNDNFDIFQANSRGTCANVEIIGTEKALNHITNDTHSNIFSDELVKTFMSQIIENDDLENSPKVSETNSLPFQNFLLNLPESTSEDSLDASVRTAMSMVKGNTKNCDDSNPENSQGEGTYGTENLTEIIPNTLQCEGVSDRWKDRHANNCLNAATDDINEASWIPGTNNLQNDFNNDYKEEPKMTSKQTRIEEVHDSIQHETKIEAATSHLSKCSRNSTQDHWFHEPWNKQFSDTDDQSQKSRKELNVHEKSEQQNSEKQYDFKTSTKLGSALQTHRKSTELSRLDLPAEPTQNISPTGSNISITGTRNCWFVLSDKNNTDMRLDEPKINMFHTTSAPSQSKNIFDSPRSNLSFGGLNKWQKKQELDNIIGNKANNKDKNDMMSHDQKTMQCSKRTLLRKPVFHPPAQFNNMNSNNQPIPKQTQPDIDLKNTCGISNEIGKMIHKTQKSIQKNVLKESLLRSPVANTLLTRDSNQEMGINNKMILRTEQQAPQDGTKRIENRFQKTPQAGHWRRNELHQSTITTLFPPLESHPNFKIDKQVNINKTNSNSSRLVGKNFNETRLNREFAQQLKMDPDQDDSQDAKRIWMGQSTIIDINVNQSCFAPQPSKDIKKNVMENTKLGQNQKPSWKLGNSSWLSTLTMSDTLPTKDQNMTVLADYRDPTKTQTAGWNLKNIGNPHKQTAKINENTVATNAEVSMQNKSVFTTENNFKHDSNIQNQPSVVSSQFQAGTILGDTELVRLDSNDHQCNSNMTKETMEQKTEKGKMPSASDLISQSRVKALQSYQTGDIHQPLEANPTPGQTWPKDKDTDGVSLDSTPIHINLPNKQKENNLLKVATPIRPYDVATKPNAVTNRSTNDTLNSVQGRGAESKENALNISGTKPRKRRQSKKPTSKRDELKKQNEFIHITQSSEISISRRTQVQKTNERKPKTTAKMSPSRRNKASTQKTGGLVLEKFEKQYSNNPISDSTINSVLRSFTSKEDPMGNRQSIINKSSNFSNTVLHPLDVEIKTKKHEEPTLMSGTEKYPEIYTNNLTYNVTSSVEGCRADLKRGSFNFFNQNKSHNDDLRGRFRSKEVEGEKENVIVNFDNCDASLNREQKFDAFQKVVQGEKCNKGGFIECENLSWDEFPDSPSTHGNLSCNDGQSKATEKNTETHAEAHGGSPNEYLSVTQLSWGQSATCEIPSYPTQSVTAIHEIYQPATSANYRNDQALGTTYLREIKNTITYEEVPIEYQTQTQLSWGQSATCEILPVPKADTTSKFDVVKYQNSKTPISVNNKGTSRDSQVDNVENRTVNDESVFKQPFPQSQTLETNQLLSFTDFMKDICASSTENVHDCVAQKNKTIEILNRFEDVRMPKKSKLPDSGNAEQLMKDPTFNWPSRNYDIKNVETRQMENGNVFKQYSTYSHQPTLGTNQQQLPEQSICTSSADNVLQSTTQTPIKVKTEEEEIDDILNEIQFVRVPHESELIVATDIEELINDQTFHIW